MKARKLFTLFSLPILLISRLNCTTIMGCWNSIDYSTTGPLSITISYGINQVGNSIYRWLLIIIVVLPDTSADVKSAALAGPAGGRIDCILHVPTVNAGEYYINALKQIIGMLLNASHDSYNFILLQRILVGVLTGRTSKTSCHNRSPAPTSIL